MYIGQGPNQSYKADIASVGAEDTSTDPENSNAKARQLVEGRVNNFNTYRRSRLISMNANIAYLCGEQNIALKNDSIVKLPNTETSLTVCNLLLPAVVNDIATATKVSAQFDIVPNSQTDEDIATAISCTKILEYLQRRNPLNLCRAQTMLWYDIDGVGWRKVYWDTSAGNAVKDENTGELVFEGEVTVECVPNNELIYDFRLKNVHKLEWIIHAKRVTKSWIRSRYGNDFAAKIAGSTHSGEERSFETEILQQFSSVCQQIMTKSPNTSSISVDAEDDEMVDYYEYWHKPCKSMPEGALIVLIGSQVAKNDPYPIEAYPHKELPFVASSPISLDGITVGSIPRISQARPIQREYNMLRSMIISHAHQLGNGVMMVPRGANLSYKMLSNVAGATIEFDGMMKPTREQGVPLPNSIFAHLGEVRRNIDEVFAFHDPSKGIMPSGGPRSAVGLQTLQNADFDQLGPVIDELEHSEEKIVYQMLSLAMANYLDTKAIAVVGEDQAWTQYKINKKKLDGKINVIVRRGSSTPNNKNSEANLAFQVWQSGLLGDPNDPMIRQHTMKQMQLGGIDGILQMHAKDMSFAKLEFCITDAMLAKMKQTYNDITDEAQLLEMAELIHVPPVNSFDEHLVHLKAHKEFVMDNYHKYKSLDAKYVYAMSMMIQHMNEHQAILNESAQINQEQSVENEAYVKGNTMEQIIAKKMSMESDKKDNNKSKEGK